MKMYNQLPVEVDSFNLNFKEFMYYQYLPIKMSETENRNDSIRHKIEDRLKAVKGLDHFLTIIENDFIKNFGIARYFSSYMYLTLKRQYQKNGCVINREGYHSDGFLTEDINYIWCDKQPTIFNNTDFILSKDDNKSLDEMGFQAIMDNDRTYPINTILRLNQYCIHKVGKPIEGIRSFIKVSFSRDRYNLEGNSHNYELDYKWKMRPRSILRNIPQEL